MNMYNTLGTRSLVCMLGLLLWAAAGALAQGSGVQITTLCDGRVALDWGGGSGQIYFDRETADGTILDNEGRPISPGPHELRRNTPYQLYIDWGDSNETISFVTSGEACKRPAPPSKPPDITCPLLPASIVVSGYGRNTQCKQVGDAGVAIPALSAQGIIDAVDVFGDVDSEVRVCFRHKGRLKFLDAATAPRLETDLAVETTKGMTCGTIDRAGTVILLQADDTIEIAPAAAESGPTSSIVCQLTTTGYLSLRGGPSVYFERLLAMPKGSRLIGMAREGDWFLVDYAGQRGWASATFLAASPGCDGIGGSSRVFLPLATEPSSVEADAPEDIGDSAQTEARMPGVWSLPHCSLRAGDIINHREGPGLEYDVIAEIPYQTILIATERTRDWFLVEYNDETGWVHIDYVFRHGCG